MRELWNLFLGALTLNSAAFAALKARPDGLRQTLSLTVSIGLIAVSPVLFDGLADAARPRGAGTAEASALAALDELMRGLPPDARQARQAIRDLREGMRLGLELDGLEPFLPRPVARAIQSVGGWLGAASGQLLVWIAYTFFAFQMAKVLGGRGTLPRMLTLTGLSMGPQVFGWINGLARFSPNPAVALCGAGLGLALWAWSSAIFVKATSAEHEIGIGRALAAWALPGILLGLLIALVGFLFLLLSLAAVAAAG